jgi:hypothetical protein
VVAKQFSAVVSSNIVVTVHPEPKLHVPQAAVPDGSHDGMGFGGAGSDGSEHVNGGST